MDRPFFRIARRAMLLALACSTPLAGAAQAALPAPSTVNSPGAAVNRAAITWSAVPGATGYRVYRNGVSIATPGKYSQSYVDPSATAGVTYSYTVATVDATGTGPQSAATSVAVPSTATVISACSSTPKPSGRYVLGGNLTASGSSPCLTFQNTANVTLDCANFTITGTSTAQALKVSGVLRFFSARCKFWLVNSGLADATVQIVAGGQILFDSAVFSGPDTQTMGGVVVQGGTSHFRVSRSQFNNTSLWTGQASDTYVGYNSFSARPSYTTNASVVIVGGARPDVVANSIDGQASMAGTSETGADDGIAIGNTSGAVISGNTIMNVWDVGIEGTDTLTDTEIAGNEIINARLGGIGNWYGLAFDRNTVLNNTVTNSRRLFWFFAAGNSFPTGRTEFSLTNNTFSGNTLNGTPEPTVPAAEFQPGTNGAFTASGNKFQNNNFGTASSTPLINPSSLVDSFNTFGNTCALPNTVLNCS